MKKFLFILGVIVIAGGVFVGGLVVGTQHDFMNAIFQASSLDQRLGDATRVFYAITYLDKNDSVGAKGWLNQELDSHIITIDQFTKDCPNPETQDHAIAFLARIAKHRQKYPSRIDVSKAVPGSAEVEKHIQAVLDNALKQKGKQNN